MIEISKYRNNGGLGAKFRIGMCQETISIDGDKIISKKHLTFHYKCGIMYMCGKLTLSIVVGLQAFGSG